MALGPRLTAEQVSNTRGWASCILPDRDSAEKPANTTLCTAPMRAHASCRHRRPPSACENCIEAQGNRLGTGPDRVPRDRLVAAMAVYYAAYPGLLVYHGSASCSAARAAAGRGAHHGSRQLGQHGHVDADIRALLDSHRLQVVGDPVTGSAVQSVHLHTRHSLVSPSPGTGCKDMWVPVQCISGAAACRQVMSSSSL